MSWTNFGCSAAVTIPDQKSFPAFPRLFIFGICLSHPIMNKSCEEYRAKQRKKNNRMNWIISSPPFPLSALLP
ncbi:hypothetical protein VTH06DRAFT_6672 [Thermothelomyces fergusii]